MERLGVRKRAHRPGREAALELEKANDGRSPGAPEGCSCQHPGCAQRGRFQTSGLRNSSVVGLCRGCGDLSQQPQETHAGASRLPPAFICSLYCKHLRFISSRFGAIQQQEGSSDTSHSATTRHAEEQ